MMIKLGNAIWALILTVMISSIIPYDNFLGLGLKVGTFQIIGGVIGIGVMLLLRERRHQSTIPKNVLH